MTEPGVLVLHSWWGLTDGMRQYAAQLADHGFRVAAPDLFEGRTAETEEEAQALRAARRRVPTYRTIEAAALDLAGPGMDPIGVVGFSMGAHWACWLAGRGTVPVAAVSLHYGMRGADIGSGTAVQLHLAEHDRFVSADAVRRFTRRLERSGNVPEVHRYPGTEHWFSEPGRPEHDRGAASLAFDRTTSMLRGAVSAF